MKNLRQISGSSGLSLQNSHTTTGCVVDPCFIHLSTRCSLVCRWNANVGDLGIENETIYIQEISRSKAVTQTMHRECKQHSSAFDARMVCVNFLVLPSAPPPPLLCFNLSLSPCLSPPMSHIPPSCHPLVCQSVDFFHSCSSEAPQLTTLKLLNETVAKLASRVGTQWLGKFWLKVLVYKGNPSGSPLVLSVSVGATNFL